MRSSSGGTLYFAYGSNLDTKHLERWLGRVPPSTIARLVDYRLAFNTEGFEPQEIYANIVPHAGSSVWGVVYECQPTDLNKLDEYEDVEGGSYRRGRVGVVTPAGKHLEADVYFACEERLCGDGQPSKRYSMQIISGAREHGLPPDYIRQIEMLAGMP
jgi:gamma-glutamylcyclotransferase